MKALKKLNELDAKLTKTIELRSQEGEEKKRGMGGALAGTALIGAGAYRYGKPGYDAMKGGATLANAGSIAGRLASEDLANAGKRVSAGYVGAKKIGKTMKKSYAASRGLNGKGVVSSAVGALRKGFKLSSEADVAKLIVELDAKIDEIHASRKARKAAK